MNDAMDQNENVSLNGVIDQNSLKGIASYIKQKKVGNLQIISSQNNNNGTRDDDIVIMEKLRANNKDKKNYEKYKDFYRDANDQKAQRRNRDDRNVYKEKI